MKFTALEANWLESELTRNELAESELLLTEAAEPSLILHQTSLL